MDIEERYEPHKLEPRWAKWWVESNIYNADPSCPRPRFSIVIPPPSVNGSLHIGHMLEHAIIDATVRWRRMRGYNTLWLPGTDHAGIATQLLVERMLASAGTSREELGREEFENRVWQWKDKYGARITEQMKQIGDSVDWSREKFTLSPELSRTVTEAFVRLYDRGLIYRATSTVSWCPRCKTAISDLETVQEEPHSGLRPNCPPPHTAPVARCDRCRTAIEPTVSTQWFVRSKPLAEKAVAAVEDGRIQFVPDNNWTGSYVRWTQNVRDWCISRQLWWGHRIPAWHCQNCLEITVARSTPPACSQCGNERLEQDRDVLDTWFSAALWPFSTLGWPDETEDLKAYYPTSLLITGFEILFFWVARMIMLGLELTGQPPFRAIHIHGLVRDANRDKISKTKGNVVDPLDITSRFGTDAVRVSLTMGLAPGADVLFSEDRLAAAWNFVSVIWDAARSIFPRMETARVEPPFLLERGRLETLEDRWIFSRLQKTANAVNRAIENHRYDEVVEALRRFFMHDLCERYLETKKLRLEENAGLTNDWRNLLAAFSAALRMLHPLMPFITEELWSRLGREDSISLQPYPAGFPVDEEAEREMALLKDLPPSALT